MRDIAADGKIYGVPMNELSYRQQRLALQFSNTTQLWLEENIGMFDQDWFVVTDKEYDSWRVQFKNLEDETYFRLSWMQQIQEMDQKQD